MRRIAFALALLWPLAASSAPSWWDCGRAFSNDEYTMGEETCIGPRNFMGLGSCRNSEVIWTSPDYVVTVWRVVNDLDRIPCNPLEDIMPGRAKDTPAVGDWFCMNDPLVPTEDNPRTLLRCSARGPN